MAAAGRDCGPLHAVYRAARDGDVEALRAAWDDFEPTYRGLDADAVDRLDDAQAAGDAETARDLAADLLFREEDPPRLDGPAATLVGTLLFGVGYLASFVLFFRADSRAAVVRRLRWAYRTVGVDVRDTETDGGVERTVFQCPYRDLGADRFGRRRVCHDVLDRVDDGYVRFLVRRRGLDYDRPRPCAASGCCYSEVAALE